MPDRVRVAPPEEVLAFWREAGPERWFKKDEAFDAAIRARFLPTYEAAAAGELSDWAETADGALALTLVLDQFPRNLFRNNAHTFATDPQARLVSENAREKGFDGEIEPSLRGFLYLPLMHSEDLGDQEAAIPLYEKLGDANQLRYAHLHADIIRRFGRFPHRNAVLGRTTTPEEQAFLDSGGFAG